MISHQNRRSKQNQYYTMLNLKYIICLLLPSLNFVPQPSQYDTPQTDHPNIVFTRAVYIFKDVDKNEVVSRDKLY